MGTNTYAAAELQVRLTRTARQVLTACSLAANETVVVLSDTTSAPVLSRAFAVALRGLWPSTDVVHLTVAPRRPAFADLPPHAVDALLAADFVLDLTVVPWLYSDSFTRYLNECRESGSRLALVWGDEESLATIAACLPSPTLSRQARQGLQALNEAGTLHARGADGTDFAVELGDPSAYPRAFIGEPPVTAGMIGAPLCASVTAPFVPGSANGTLVFHCAGRFQGPENLPIRSTQPVTIRIADGRVADVQGNDAVAISLRDWFASASDDDGSVLMDCNIGYDPRADLDCADNTVVHSFAGGMMVGFGNPYTYRPGGSHRPGYHLDLMFPGLDIDLDDKPFVRAGRFVLESGID